MEMASQSQLESVEEALKRLADRCSLQLQSDPDNELLKASQDQCTKLLHQMHSGDNNSLPSYLQGYTQACLDYTYADENRLVEEEFPSSTSDNRIKKIFEHLDHCVELTSELLPNQKSTQVVDVLTAELYECISWRKGALLYMYCCCVQDSERPTGQQFCSNLQEGVGYLQDMLRVRTPMQEGGDELVFSDTDTVHLLMSGLFTDVHVLALMYMGEMCFWHKKYSKLERSSDFNVEVIGRKVLEDYIDAVRGPLNGKGWNCERAEELLKELESK